MNDISALNGNFRIYPNVELGGDCVIGDFAVIGVPPAKRTAGELMTRIGSHSLIRSHTVIYAGNIIGAHFMTGHGALIREENQIGDNVSIGSHSIIEHHVILGNGVRVHSNTFIPEFSVLEEGAWVGPGVVFTNVLHPLCPEVSKCIKGPLLKKGVKIGANATLMPGIVIGEMAMVAAGSVVVRDVPDRAVVAGNPAKIIKTVDELKCPFEYLEHPYPVQS